MTKLHNVKRMTKNIGGLLSLTCFQPLNWWGAAVECKTAGVECKVSCGQFFVIRIGDEGQTWCYDNVLLFSLIRFPKTCSSILTAGRWPWKLTSPEECVTIHLPNELALKMAGAQMGWLMRICGGINIRQQVGWCTSWSESCRFEL